MVTIEEIPRIQNNRYKKGALNFKAGNGINLKLKIGKSAINSDYQDVEMLEDDLLHSELIN